MKRKAIIIGIGAGNPEYVTIQAVNALNEATVFFIPDKGTEKESLARVRRDICERYIRDGSYRTVDFAVPGRAEPTSSYRKSVEAWRDEVEHIYERLLAEELGEDDCGAFLVWGDPSLYDGTLRILQNIRSHGNIELEYDVVPGISSVQALTARHRIALNRIGQPVMITTGRRLAQGFPENADSVVVMLDAEGAYKAVDGDVEVHWGAYIGTEDEILVSGKLREVAGEIERVRDAARARHGWIMDTYLLRRSEGGDE